MKRIASAISCSKNTVLKWRQRYLETGDVQRKEGTGRANKRTSVDQDRAILTAVERNPITTSSEIAGIDIRCDTTRARYYL